MEKNYELKDLIRDLTAVVDKTDKDSERVTQAEEYVGKLICSRAVLPIGELESAETSYARHALYRDPQDRFEILALVWEPGQKTPLHDHDGTWGVEGIVSGRMKVTNYLQLEALADDKVKLAYSGTATLNELSTGELLPPADCHILEPLGGERVVTIHVYGKQLKSFKVFNETDESGIYDMHIHPVGYTTDSVVAY